MRIDLSRVLGLGESIFFGLRSKALLSLAKRRGSADQEKVLCVESFARHVMLAAEISVFRQGAGNDVVHVARQRRRLRDAAQGRLRAAPPVWFKRAPGAERADDACGHLRILRVELQ